MIARFFFYGTLRRGQTNHALVEGARSVVRATIEGLLYHLPAGYPALVDGAGTVRGELVTFSPSEVESLLARLDDLEGFVPASPATSLYLRELRWARTARGRARAWVYVFPAERLGTRVELVEGGDWVRWSRRAAR